MAINSAIDLTPLQQDTIKELISKYLPNPKVWIYGLRAKSTSRIESDLDMGVFSKPEQNCAVSNLRETFEESNIPFRVDLFIWDEIPASFRE